MLEWLGKIDTSKLKKIYLVHGDHEAQEFFANKLRSAGFQVEIVKAMTRYKL
jgi:metallo-beta-lactamase family protein